MRAPPFAVGLVGWAALALAGAGAACAQDKPTFEAKIEKARHGGHALRVRGVAKNYPDQTRLVVKFLVKAKNEEVGTWEAGVSSGAFDATISFEGREAAPLVYRVELWLMLPRQLDPVKKWFQRQLGVTQDHTEMLDAAEVAQGTPQERRTFDVENLKLFAEVLKRATPEHGAIETALGEAPSDWAKKKDEINGRLLDLQTLTNRRARKYVTLGDPALAMVQHVVDDALNALEAVAKKPEEAKRSLVMARRAAEQLQVELETRLPKENDKDEGKGGEKPKAQESEHSGAEKKER